MNFYKYQSLGNDFVLLDHIQSEKTEKLTPEQVKTICHRNFGVGADGILIITSINDQIHVQVINSDGFPGGKSYNGLRCVSWHLHLQRHFPNQFEVIASGHVVKINIKDSLISMNVGVPKYIEKKTIEVDNQKITGHIIDVGNPHFVVLQKIDLDWLKHYGKFIENHFAFPNRTNVEFIWKNGDDYEMLVHERGCGITLSCGTGCCAVIKTLFELHQIEIEQKIKIKTQGGELITFLNQSQEIIQKANATLVFTGEWKKVKN